MRTKKITMTELGYSIPLDMIFQILLRLPPKSVLRFRCVSKSWCSIIDSQEFKDAFMSPSLSRPRLALVLNNPVEDRSFFFFSDHQSCFFRSSSLSLMVVTDKNTFTMPKLKTRREYICNYSVRGFICCRLQDWYVVCNPSTGQVIRLGEKYNNNYYYCRMYLGYDPNNDEYKVLRLMSPKYGGSCIEHSVLTLGGQESSHSWRPINGNINIPKRSYCYDHGVYIDGVVYYKYMNDKKTVVASFDVGSEQLSLIATHEDFGVELRDYLTNYLGKLAIYCHRSTGFVLWVLDDVQNQVWSKMIHILPCLGNLNSGFCYAGIATGGEIFYVSTWYSDSFELLFYDVEKKTERRVKVEGVCYNKPPPGRMTVATLLCPYVDNIIYFSDDVV